MLQFLLNSCISAALTKQPSTYYSKYLREFWYTAEVGGVTNTVTFTLSCFDKPLSFTLDDFSSITGLKYNWKKLLSLPEETLILPSNEVNADQNADKSLSRTAVQLITQSKAPTDKKSKKKKNLSSSQPKILKIVRVSSPLKQVIETRHAEEPVTTADATKGIKTSKSAEELRNQTKPADAEKVHENIVEEAVKCPEITSLEIKEADFDSEAIPDDEIIFVSDFEEANDDDSENEEELSKNDEANADNVLDELVDMANT
ncbi:hypothetical protein Tco_1074772 [Tanacetum coccineum]